MVSFGHFFVEKSNKVIQHSKILIGIQAGAWLLKFIIVSGLAIQIFSLFIVQENILTFQVQIQSVFYLVLYLKDSRYPLPRYTIIINYD